MKRGIWVLFSIAVLITSCTEPFNSFESEEGYQDVILNIDIPKKFETRAQTAAESRINDVMVLVFESGEYQYMASGISIANNSSNSTASFKARLVSTDATLRLFIVANATNEIINSGISQGDSEETVKQKVFRNFNAVGFPFGFPMFGQYELEGIPSTGAIISGIRLVRSIARVDVDATLVQSNFKLGTIQTFRATNTIQVIPNNLPATNIVTIPSVQDDWTASVNIPAMETTSETQSTQQVYLPESVTVGDESNFEQATCVVIGGYYNGSTDLSYYRLDFRKSDGTYPFGQILRNHQYLFTINSVEGAGWTSPEEAANNMESGITVTVQEWNEEGLGAYFDGTHHFIISPRRLQLQYRADATDYMSVETNVDDYTIEWTEGEGAGIPSGSTLTNEYFEVTISADKTQIIVRTLQENDTDNEIISPILIRAKRLVIPVLVSQLPRTKYDNEIIRVLSFNEVGSFGGGDLTTITPASFGARAMRVILQQHFGPGKTVGVGNILFTYIDASINTVLTDDLLSQQDILFLNNNIRPNATMAKKILNWLDAKSSRVLMLGYDWKDPGTGATRTNWEVLKLLKEQNQITPYWYNGGSSTPVEEGDYPGTRLNFRAPFVINESTRYFFRDGPFTSTPYTPITSCYYWSQDQFWGRADVHSPNIIPLINFTNPLSDTSDDPKSGWTYDQTGDGRMILGVDPTRRIVYVGDVQMFITTGADNVYRRAARIGDENGQLSNDYSRIMANLWAWMVEEVVLAN